MFSPGVGYILHSAKAVPTWGLMDKNQLTDCYTLIFVDAQGGD